MQKYSVGQMAILCGCSVNTLQKYDRDKTLIAHRSEKGRRYYLTEDVDKYRAIQEKKHSVPNGYTVKEFAQKLDVSRQYLFLLEKQGKVIPNRTEEGRVYYTDESMMQYTLTTGLSGLNIQHEKEITQLYSTESFAKAVGVSVSKIRELCRTGQIEYSYRDYNIDSVKHLYFFTNIDLQKFLENFSQN